MERAVRVPRLKESQKIRPTIDWNTRNKDAERQHNRKIDEQLLELWLAYSRKRMNAAETADLCEVIVAELREHANRGQRS
jgi:hypothetical protein